MTEKLNADAGKMTENTFTDAMKDVPAFKDHAKNLTEETHDGMTSNLDNLDKLKDDLGIEYLSLSIINPNTSYTIQYDDSIEPTLREHGMPTRPHISTDGRVENAKFRGGIYDEESDTVENYIDFEVKDATWVLKTEVALSTSDTKDRLDIIGYQYTLYTDNLEKAMADLRSGIQKDPDWGKFSDEKLSDVFGDKLSDFYD